MSDTLRKALEPFAAEADRDDPIVGHKTFSTGETDPETGFPAMRHEPLRRSEANAILEAARVAERKRATDMPNEQSAIRAMFDAWLRLTELGWKEAIYCPKDGTPFDAIEAGSTGIFRCNYSGKWPTGGWWCEDGGDLWPSHPILFRPLPSPPEEPATLAKENEDG